MALNTGINSLNAGAPDIKYTGTEGPQDPRTASAPSGEAELYQMYQDALPRLPRGTTFEMFKELLRQSRGSQQSQGVMAAGPTYTQRRRNQMAGGGITQIGKPGGLVEPGISKYAWYDFIVDPVKEFVTEKALPIATKIGQTLMPGGDPGYIDLYGGDKPQIPMPQGSPGEINPYTPPIFPTSENWIQDIFGGAPTEIKQDPWY